MIDISFTEELKAIYPEASIGILLIKNIENKDNSNILDKIKTDSKRCLRYKYSSLSRGELVEIRTIKSYRKYYKKFKKTYHLLLQMESISRNGKSYPSVNPLVDSCFISEMNTFILTAGHDADKLESSILFDLSREAESFTQINGKEILLKPDDIIMRDNGKAVCSIIYGQDNISKMTPDTERALFVAYAPEGVKKEDIIKNLEYIRYFISKFSPDSETEIIKVFTLKTE
jgi:DNA/RNA-binding domain of Phe-tRNA-synthetase-like protein